MLKGVSALFLDILSSLKSTVTKILVRFTFLDSKCRHTLRGSKTVAVETNSLGGLGGLRSLHRVGRALHHTHHFPPTKLHTPRCQSREWSEDADGEALHQPHLQPHHGVRWLPDQRPERGLRWVDSLAPRRVQDTHPGGDSSKLWNRWVSRCLLYFYPRAPFSSR